MPAAAIVLKLGCFAAGLFRYDFAFVIHVFEADCNLLTDSGFLHRHSVQRRGGGHSLFGVSYDDEFRPVQELI